MRKLSPAVLAALGLTACVDGCDVDEIPLLDDLFGDDDDAAVHPCLKVALPPDTDIPVGPCLEMTPCLSPMPEPDLQPCLSQIPEVELGACLKIVIDRNSPVPNPGPDVGPCLRLARPPDVGPCLDMVAPVHPCLSMPAPPTPAPIPPPVGEKSGAVPSRDDVLRRLIAEGVLPADVLDRATTGTAGRRPG